MLSSKEIEETLNLMRKAIAEKQPAPNVITIMKKLQNEVVPTETILRTTKAGVLVSKQKANPDKSIARLASEIVSKWRGVIEAEKKKNTPGKMSPNAAVSSPAPVEESKGFVGDVTKRKWETDDVSVKRTGNQTRDSCIGLIYNGLAFMSRELPVAVLKKAIEVEAAAFTKFKGDGADYKAKIRSLFQNLKNKTNRELGPSVMSGETPAERFVSMSHDELKSADLRKEEEKLQKENMKNAQVPIQEKSISDALKCGKCQQKKVSYSQAQTRSADEPMTTFCECTVCGNRWKFS